MKSQEVTLDEVLDKFSIFGRYHLKFMFLIWFSFATNAFHAIQFIFAAEKVDYRCRDEEVSGDSCSSVNGTTCTDWIYDDPHSFVAEFDLACQEWKRTLVGTIHGFGYMFGVLLTGPLADRFGGKTVTVLTGVLGGVLGLAKSYVYSYWLYIALEFLGGAFGDNYLTLHVLRLETVSTKKRVMFSTLSNVGFGLGGISVPLAAWSVSYWRYFLRTLYTPQFLIITYTFLLDESPRWLLVKGEKKKAVAVLKKIEKTNKMKLDLDLEKLASEFEPERVSFGKVLKMTFVSRVLLARSMISIIWWASSTFVSYGMKINSVALQGNKYLNFALVEGLILPSYFIIMYVLTKFKRRNPLIWSFLSSSVLCLIHPFLPQEYPWLSLLVYMLGKFMNGFCFAITYMYTSELFPTYTRNSMQALCSSIGRIGSILAPLTPLLVTYWDGLPSMFFGGASLIAGLLTFLVPDTADHCLPDTVKEAEIIGKKDNQVTGISNLAVPEDKIT